MSDLVKKLIAVRGAVFTSCGMDTPIKPEIDAAIARITELEAEVGRLRDNAEGLQCDLYSALDIIHRLRDGEAREWLRLNYPARTALGGKDEAT